MQSSFYRRTLPKLIFALVALTIGVFLSRGEIPVTDASFTAGSVQTISSKVAGANADTTVTLTIANGDLNFSNVTTTTPAAAFVAPGPGNPGFVGGTHPALGDVIGSLSSQTNLGLTNGLCQTAITVDFTFLNATTDVTDVIQPVPQPATNSGDQGTLNNQWTDNGASTGATLSDPPWTTPGGWADTAATIPALTPAEQANGLPAQVDDYPAYLNTLFTPDSGPSAGIPVQPLARYAGAKNVANTAVMLNLVIFAPDALSNAFQAPHPFNDTKGLGYVSIAVLNDPTTEAAPGSITDFCSPLLTITRVKGVARANPCNGVTTAPCNNPAGISLPCTDSPDTCTGLPLTLPRYANPATAGTHLWIGFQQSLRDSDSDGKENAVDTCPLTADTFDIRAGGGAPDTDGDGIPDACDTNANATNDNDTDGWMNRGDNCPLISNPTNAESENTPTTYLTAAKKGGPRTDSLGDPCDPSATSANGPFETTLTVSANCIGNVDGDNDGWCAAAGPASPASLNDPNDANVNRTPEDYDLVYAMGVANGGSGATPPMRQPAQVCNDGIDNDGDGLIDNLDQASGASTCRPKGVAAHPGFPACPATGCANIDTDGDGYTDEVERHVGTDSLGRCGVGAVPALSTMWPSDFASGGIPLSTDKITVTDLTSFLAPARRLDQSPGDPNFNVRWDLTPGPGVFAKWVNVNDLTSLIAGASGFPPMFSGVKAFGGAACTAGPMD